jgi:hypothetical protein
VAGGSSAHSEVGARQAQAGIHSGAQAGIHLGAARERVGAREAAGKESARAEEGNHGNGGGEKHRVSERHLLVNDIARVRLTLKLAKAEQVPK